MRILQDYFGVAPVFGIVTTYLEWRVCWLHCPDAHLRSFTSGLPVPTALSEVQRFFQNIPSINPVNPTKKGAKKKTPPQADKTSPAFASASGPAPGLASGAGPAPGPELSHSDFSGTLYVSKVYTFSHSEMPIVLTTAITLMASAIVMPQFLSTERRLFASLSNATQAWVVGALESLEPMQISSITKPPRTDCVFYLVADMHGGAHGVVFLARTCAGTVHVLKFMIPSVEHDSRQSLKDKAANAVRARKVVDDARDKEYSVWMRAYPALCDAGLVFKRDFPVAPVLGMPRFGHVADPPDAALRRLAEAEARRLAALGIVHTDLAWRHVGIYVDQQNQQCCVFFDLASVDLFDEPASPDSMLSSLT
eukprot:m.264608 g.264608  ORF g.264608 m.264608 type:complete len:365 (-) comp28354_c0_seq1:77-1171(-)